MELHSTLRGNRVSGLGVLKLEFQQPQRFKTNRLWLLLCVFTFYLDCVIATKTQNDPDCRPAEEQDTIIETPPLFTVARRIWDV